MSRWGMAGAGLVLLPLALSGCSAFSSSQHEQVRCPQVVNYSDAQLTAIQDSINKLPKNDALRGAMSDYESLRDDARYCVNLQKEGG